jgi:hypothetical protein
MRNSLKALAFVTAFAVASPVASGGVIRVTQPFEIVAEGLRQSSPPAFVVTFDVWEKIDSEMRRLQDTETRLSAENDSLKQTREAHVGSWSFWLGVGAGVALGGYISYRIYSP